VLTLPPVPRRWLVDVGLTVVVLVSVEIAIVSAREPHSVAPDWFAYALGVAMALPVLLRRRYPVTSIYLVGLALLIFYAMRYRGFPPALVMVVPLYACAVAGYIWASLPVPVFFLGSGMFVTLRHGTSPFFVVDLFLPQIALVAVAMLLGALVRSRRAYAAEVTERLRLAEEERESEAQRRVVVERLRIARELHDTVAHAIATITVQSSAASHLIGSDPERAREAVDAIRQTGKSALAEMRTTLEVLRADERPVLSDRDSGLDRLPALLEAVRAAGLDVTVTGELAGHDLPRPVDHAAYRIVQESLTNVLRHAGAAATASVAVTVDPESITLEVTDDGVGGSGSEDPGSGSAGWQTTGGHGLSGMQERVESLGGEFSAGARPSGGFTVLARLPREVS